MHRRIGRAGLFAGVGVLAALNGLANNFIRSFDPYPNLAFLLDLAGVSAVVWFAIFATLKIGWDTGQEPLRGADRPVLLIVIGLSLFPAALLARLGLLICAIYFFVTTRPAEPARRVALILLALTGTLFWGPLILNAFAGPILGLDAEIVARVMGATVSGNIVYFPETGQRYVIFEGCSSVHNISLAIVLWATAVALFDLRVDSRLVAYGVAMVALMFALNIARLCAIGLFPDHFEYLHGGGGAALFGWAELIGAAAIAGFGVSNAIARQR